MKQFIRFYRYNPRTIFYNPQPRLVSNKFKSQLPHIPSRIPPNNKLWSSKILLFSNIMSGVVGYKISDHFIDDYPIRDQYDNIGIQKDIIKYGFSVVE